MRLFFILAIMASSMVFGEQLPSTLKVTSKDGAAMVSSHRKDSEGRYSIVGALSNGSVRKVIGSYGTYMVAKIISGKTNVGKNVVMWIDGQTNGVVGGPKAPSGCSAIASFDANGAPVLAGWSLWPGDRVEKVETFVTWWQVERHTNDNFVINPWIYGKNVEVK